MLAAGPVRGAGTEGGPGSPLPVGREPIACCPGAGLSQAAVLYCPMCSSKQPWRVSCDSRFEWKLRLRETAQGHPFMAWDSVRSGELQPSAHHEGTHMKTRDSRRKMPERTMRRARVPQSATAQLYHALFSGGEIAPRVFQRC